MERANVVREATVRRLPTDRSTGTKGYQATNPVAGQFPNRALSGPVAPRCSESGKISSECAVTRGEPVFGFCGALVLTVQQLGVRWRWVGPLLGPWPDIRG